MTEYEVRQLASGFGGNARPVWRVRSTDDMGEVHVTLFIGPAAEGRAKWYADYMNRVNKHPVVYLGE